MVNNKMNIEGKNYSDIPVWRRYTLTIEEAARYYHIGEGKLRTLIDTHSNEDFYVMNGNRALIKREKFERYNTAGIIPHIMPPSALAINITISKITGDILSPA